MKVLYLTRKYPPAVGGAERVNAELAHHLAREVPVRLLADDCRTVPRILRLSLRALREEWRATERVTHVFVGDGLLAPLGLLLARRHRAKAVVWAHGLDVAYPSPIYQRFVVPALRRADRIIAVSESTRRLLLERGVEGERIRVLPHGREAVREGTGRNEARRRLGVSGPLVVFVGRLVRRKGVATFLSDVFERLPDARLFIAGEGPESGAISRLIEARGWKDRVRLLGRIDESEKDLVYRAADCMVMPNLSLPGDPEGFGLVALEAAARGIPTVGYAVDSLPEVIGEGTSGRLVAPGDAAGFAAAVEAFLTLSDGRRAELARSCLAWAERWPEWAQAARGFTGAIQ